MLRVKIVLINCTLMGTAVIYEQNEQVLGCEFFRKSYLRLITMVFNLDRDSSAVRRLFFWIEPWDGLAKKKKKKNLGLYSIIHYKYIFYAFIRCWGV
jgi:hypothetical protein